MFKICLILALSIAGVLTQQPAPGDRNEAAPEPYAYAYEADSHSASEQKDENGKVTGFYTIADADGRSRRVEYFADQSGFHAKVQTNEVGTKSDNPADVQIQAAPPTEAQFAYQSSQYVQQAPQQQLLVQQQIPQYQQRPTVYQYQPGVTGVTYTQQPPSYNYYGYQYNPGQVGYTVQPGVGSSSYESSSSSQYGTGAVYGGYNYHLPASYYAARSSGALPGQGAGAQYTRTQYSSGPAVYRTVQAPVSGSSSYSYRSYSGPAVSSGVSSSGPVPQPNIGVISKA